MIGMEPTGHYWLNLAYYLKSEGIKTIVVSPMKVKRSKELNDDSPTKNDTKDAKVIAQGQRKIMLMDIHECMRKVKKNRVIIKKH